MAAKSTVDNVDEGRKDKPMGFVIKTRQLNDRYIGLIRLQF